MKFRYHDSDDVDEDVAELISNAGFVVDSCAHFISYINFSNVSDPYYRGKLYVGLYSSKTFVAFRLRRPIHDRRVKLLNVSRTSEGLILTYRQLEQCFLWY